MYTIKYIFYAALIIPFTTLCMKKGWEAECTQERRSELSKQFSRLGFTEVRRHRKIRQLIQKKIKKIMSSLMALSVVIPLRKGIIIMDMIISNLPTEFPNYLGMQ